VAEDVSYGIVRREFDDFLLRRAEASGAEVREGVRVQAIERVNGHVALDVGGRRCVTPLVIGAGGHHCPVARALGEIAAEEKVVVARECETRLGAPLLREMTARHGTPELFAEPDFRGYGWYFTKGDFLNLGIGCVRDDETGAGDGRDLHQRCEAMVRRLREDGRLPENVELEPFKGHAYAIRVRGPRRVAGPGFLLVGDAAGIARGVSGEGIGPAVESGSLAADLVVGRKGEPSDRDGLARRYAEEIDRRFGRAQGWASRLVDLAPMSWIAHAARAVCRAPYLRRRLIFEGAFGMS
jgi:flavin-dependent dehydrogenase